MIVFIILSSIFTQWLETQIIVGKSPVNLCYNSVSHKVYSGNCEGKSISIIDAGRNEVITTISGLSNSPGGLCYNSRNNKIYCSYGDSILIIDGATDQIIKRMSNASYSGFSLYNPINNKVYFANAFSNNITVFDGERDSLIKIIERGIGEMPGNLYLISHLNKIYCLNHHDTIVSVISSDLDSVIKVIPVTRDPEDITYNSKNNKIYVTHWYDPIVSVISVDNDSLIRAINVGTIYLLSICYDSVYNKIYVSTIGPEIIVIDGETDMVIDRIRIQGHAWIVFYNPINKKIYCSYTRSPLPWEESIIAIIDSRTRQIINTIPLYRRGAFYHFCFNPRDNRVYIPHAIEEYPGGPPESTISVIKDVVGIEEISFSPIPIKIKPGFIILPSNVESIEIYDINGRLIKKAKGYKIPVKEIKSGIYFIRIFADKKGYIKKIVIK